MKDIVTVYTVCASRDEAEAIARKVVTEGLAVCANILGPCRSIYRWQGKIEEADEVPIIFKARAGKGDELMARIAALQSYDVPAITAWPAAAHEAYAKWLGEEHWD